MSELQLEVGKSYRNRTGKVVKIIGQGDYGLCAYIDSDARAYKADGRYVAGNSLHPYDLIEEVCPEPKRRKVKWPIRGRVKRKEPECVEAVYFTPEEVERIICNPSFEAHLSSMQKTHPATYPEAEESFGPLVDAKAAFERAVIEYEAEPEAPEPPELAFTKEQFTAALLLAGIDTKWPDMFYKIAALMQETTGNPTLSQVMEVWDER